MPGFRIDEIAPQDETKERTFDILGHKTVISYYPNRLKLENNDALDAALAKAADDAAGVAGEGGEEDVDETYLIAARVCNLVHAWDWEGPVKRLDGAVVVAVGEAVPLDPAVVRCIPNRIVRALNDAISEAEFPTSRRDRRAARSSRR